MVLLNLILYKAGNSRNVVSCFSIAIICWHTYVESATESCILELSVQALLQTEVLSRYIKYYSRKETGI